MKTYSRLTLAFLLLILVVPQVGADEPPKDGKAVKVWSDSSGKYKIEATFVELVDDKLVVLKRASDGKVIKVPLNKLDQESKSQAKDLHADAKAQPKNGKNKTDDVLGKDSDNDAKLKWDSTNKKIDKLNQTRNFKGAKKLAKKNLQLAKKSLSSEEIAISLNTFARAILDYAKKTKLLFRDGKPDREEAESLYLEALTIGEEKLGEFHPALAVSLIRLSELKQAAGQFNDAIELAERSLKINENCFGPDHRFTADSLYQLSSVLYVRGGGKAAALPLAKRCLEIREKTLGKNHPCVADVLLTIVATDESLSLQQEKKIRERCLAIYEKSRPESIYMVAVLGSLWMIELRLGDREKSNEYRRRADRIRNKIEASKQGKN